MAGNYNASDITSAEAVKANTEGLNVRKFDYTFNADTASGSTTINIGRLPGGAQVADVHFLASNGLGGTGGESVFIKDSEGNVYLSTTAFSTSLRANASGLMTRLTSSANLVVQLCEVVGTGTASLPFSVLCQYLTEQDPD